MGRKVKVDAKSKQIISEKYQLGHSVTELANEFQVTRNTIKNYLKEVGIWEKGTSLRIDLNDKNILGLLCSDLSAVELARELGCSLDTVRRKRLQINGKKDVPKEKRKVYIVPEVKGGIKSNQRYHIERVEYQGKRYFDITDIFNNLNSFS